MGALAILSAAETLTIEVLSPTEELILTIDGQESANMRPGDRLELRGLISSEMAPSENNRRAKFYQLTKTGRARLGQEVTTWNRLADAMALALGSLPQES